MTDFTGPGSCAECGSELNDAMAMAGGVQPATVEIKGHQVKVPGLYRCYGCQIAVFGGMRPSLVTPEAAAAYLDNIYGPAMVGALMSGEEDAAEVAEYLAECLEVSTVLWAVIQLQDEPGGLDFIPECEGKCGRDHGQDKSLAHLN